MTRRVGKKGLALIKSFESFVPYVYDDLLAPVKGKYREWDGGAVKGTLTIGYGHTDAAKHDLKIEQGLRISESKALAILDVDLDECEEAVNKLVTVKLTQGQFDALVSFAFNCGAGNLKKLIAPLNRGDYGGCRAKFDEFTRSKGQVLRGLVRRRDAEQALWDDRYDEIAMPEEPVDHPAEVDAPVPPPKSGVTESAIAGGGLGTAVVVNEAWNAVKEAPESLISGLLQRPSILIGIAVVAVFLFILWKRRQAKAVA
jgi:GH24 family phage-related lysozyme (muramidase)